MAQFIRIKKLGRSLHALIPNAVARKAGLKSGKRARLMVHEGAIHIRSVEQRPKTYSLAWLLHGYRRPRRQDRSSHFGPARGRELL